MSFLGLKAAQKTVFVAISDVKTLYTHSIRTVRQQGTRQLAVITNKILKPGSEVVKLFSCSNQLSMKFHSTVNSS